MHIRSYSLADGPGLKVQKHALAARQDQNAGFGLEQHGMCTICSKIRKVSIRQMQGNKCHEQTPRGGGSRGTSTQKGTRAGEVREILLGFRWAVQGLATTYTGHLIVRDDTECEDGRKGSERYRRAPHVVPLRQVTRVRMSIGRLKNLQHG